MMHVSVPITALYAGILTILLLVLAGRVVAVRRSAGVGLGDGGNELLLRRIRIHANAVEYVPSALLLMLVLELSGASAGVLHALGATLVVARVMHAQGLETSTGASVGRMVGVTLTWLVLIAGAIDAILIGVR
jgi:uncharacterized protein